MISAVVAVTPSMIFNSTAEAVTSVPPIFIESAVNLPSISVARLTVNLLASRSINPVLDECPIVELSITMLSTVKLPACMFPVVLIKLFPTLIEPKLEVIEPESSAPVVTMLEAPLIGAKLALAVAVFNLELSCVWMELVTPLTNPNSFEVVLIPDNLFNSAAVEVTSVAPIRNVLADNFPDVVKSLLTVNELLANTIKLVLLTCPIVELLITTLSTAKSPAVMLPSVLIVLEPGYICPKFVVIEPDDNAPTVVIVEAPELAINAESASDLVYLLFNCVWIELVTPFTYPNSVDVVLIPSSLFKSEALEVTAVLPNVRLFTANPALIVVLLPITNESEFNVNKPGLDAWPMFELFNTRLSTSSEPAYIAPDVVILLEPVLIDPKLDVIEPLSNAPTVTIELLPAFGANVFVALLDDNKLFIWFCKLPVAPDTKFNSCCVAVKPLSLLISSLSAVTPFIILSSDTDASTTLPLTINWVASNLPLIVTLPAEKAKLDPVLCCIVELLMLISSTSNSPPVILPNVVIVLDPVSILPKPLVILPELRAPTVTILPPAEFAIALSTCDLVYLSSNAALTLVVKLLKWLILSLVTVTPSRILSSAAVEVTTSPSIFNDDTSILPAIVTFPLVREIKSKSSLCPIVAPLATTLPTLKAPDLIELLPTSISPNPLVILPELSAPTVTILDVPVVAPKAASASALVYLLLNSVLTSVVPILSVVALRVPSTVTELSVNTSKSLFPVYPILESPIVMSPVINSPPVIAEDVVIEPKLPDIEPVVKWPPVATSVLRAYLSSAAVLVYLSSNWVCIPLDTPLTNPNSWAVVANPSNLFISATDAVISWPEICNLLALISPLVP